jgi:hypothetical protein
MKKSTRTRLAIVGLVACMLVVVGCNSTVAANTHPTNTTIPTQSGPLQYYLFPNIQFGADTVTGRVTVFDHMALTNLGNAPVKIVSVNMMKIPSSVRVVAAVSEGLHQQQLGLGVYTWPYPKLPPSDPPLSWIENFGSGAVVPGGSENLTASGYFDSAIVSIGLTPSANGTYPIFGIRIVYEYKGVRYTEAAKGFSVVLCVGKAASSLVSGCNWPIVPNSTTSTTAA